jgi:ABC-type antimicrobial peptide transport system permease subunit
MFFLSYALAELRHRRGRTILTALGLAVGVGLVVTVNALSTGLDHAQRTVLAPLTGVGTDMSVSRPIKITNNGNGTFGGLSRSERNRLRRQRASTSASSSLARSSRPTPSPRRASSRSRTPR